MKLATYSDSAGTYVGVLSEDALYRIEGAATMQDVIGDGLEATLERGRAALAAGEGVPLSSVRLEAPLQPSTMRDSMCFHEHIVNCMGEVDPLHLKIPVFYLSNPWAVIGPSDDAPISPGTQMFDYELEVAAVIGRSGRNIPTSEAQDHIVGYTMYIDWSARDLQLEEMEGKLGPAKGKDGATTLGPVVVTADEFEPLRKGKGFDIGMRLWVNGEQLCDGNWSTINWTFDDVVTYTSRGTQLQTGDILGSGTVGTGCLVEINRAYPEKFKGWLKEGDVVTFEVDLIGRMDIRVAAAEERHPISTGH